MSTIVYWLVAYTPFWRVYNWWWRCCRRLGWRLVRISAFKPEYYDESESSDKVKR